MQNYTDLQSSLDVIGLTKSFGNKIILDEINFSFKPGKIYALLAPNGSGKTTFMKCLSSLCLYKGLVVYQNTKVSSYFNSQIVYSPSTPLFENSLIKVFDYISEFCILRNLCFKDVLLKFRKNNNLSSLESEECLSLSTGEKKIFQIFLDTLTDPSVLIFDEPLNGLDHWNRENILTDLKKFAKLKKIVIFSTHILSDIQNLVDEILILKDGQIFLSTNPKISNFSTIYEKYFPKEENV